MNLLILGGTIFLGRYLVEAALAHGHAVTLFKRIDCINYAAARETTDSAYSGKMFCLRFLCSESAKTEDNKKKSTALPKAKTPTA